MRDAAWYVIQVQTGREPIVCKLIEQACDGGKSLKECFSPRYAYQRKRHGKWVDEEMPLLPGYVIAVADDPWSLLKAMRGIPEFTKILTMDKMLVPLDKDEKNWIERWTHEGDRTIPMSVAYKEHDRIVITDGPLVGREAMITRINRRKSVAHLEVHAGQLTIHTTVGLAVLAEKPGTEDGELKVSCT